MVPYAVLYSYFLLVSMTPFYIQACSPKSIVQNPYELDVGKTTDVKFTCMVYSDCNVSVSYVEKNGKILASIPPEIENTNIVISGEWSNFTATIKKPIQEDDLGIYYCNVKVSVNGTVESISGGGTHVYSVSGAPSFWTKTGLVVALLWTCVGMIYKEL